VHYPRFCGYQRTMCQEPGTRQEDTARAHVIDNYMDSDHNSLDPSTLFLAESEIDAMVTTNDNDGCEACPNETSTPEEFYQSVYNKLEESSEEHGSQHIGKIDVLDLDTKEF
jgi:hypothetical protein